MKKVLFAAAAMVMLLGAGCSGSSATGGAKAAKSFSLQGHTFTLPNPAWSALANASDSSIEAITTSSGMALFEMVMDVSDPVGPPEFKAEGVGEFYPFTNCSDALVCYGFLDTKDNSFWRIQIGNQPSPAMTVAEAKALLASVKRN